MSLTYGYVKCKIAAGKPVFLKSSRRKHELQYHLHATLVVGPDADTWDTAINVGTNDSDDLLRYKLIYDFKHAVISQLKTGTTQFNDLTGSTALPAYDFLRSDVLAETGPWRDSDVMDGSEHPEPVASLKRLLLKAQSTGADVYIWGRTYTSGGSGIHDVHMNQGSSGGFVNNGVDDHNDHNDIWQDGAVMVDLDGPEWAAYFTAFTQQLVPTDNLGNTLAPGQSMDEADDGSLQ